ncbi:DUF2511 domain-containing protein [Kitasatospora sp. CB01950]|uniref:DUF2511 domain-containing protein n=1 Tax=Kitasatospora sp. CB01950 TaxID=1703930 RepID=UPI00116130B7|nr:DUF2511 domain-containing protein [Kitasatospora sp. CB01950]
MKNATRRTVTAVAALLFPIAVLTGCGAVGGDPKSGKTAVPLPTPTGSRQDVAEENFVHLWPFKVDKGTLECRNGKDVLFIAPDGKEYALNDQAKNDGFGDVGPVHDDDVSLGAVRSQALRLCDPKSG